MARASFSYVQARIQARHGARPRDAEWQALEAALSFEQYLERSRGGGIASFSGRIGIGDDAHTIEARLREAWRAHVGEVAAWAPRPWQAAVRWCAYLTDLPVLSHLVDGGRPLPWMVLDPVFKSLADAAPAARVERLREFDLEVLAASAIPTSRPRGTMYAAWLENWRALWPACSNRDRASMEQLVSVASDALHSVAAAETVATSDLLRRRVAKRIESLFRSASGGPAAMFHHLALTALDVERLRGGLLRRRLLGTAMAEVAWR